MKHTTPTLQSTRSCSAETYYEILSVKEDASPEEIRASYRMAALNSHPDKSCNKLDQSPHASFSHERFLMVQTAWQILSNPDSRARYDQALIASRVDLVNDEVRLEDMTVRDSNGEFEFLHSCRCGDCFAISSAELEEIGLNIDENGKLKTWNGREPESIVFQCYSCSLKIRVIVDPDC